MTDQDEPPDLMVIDDALADADARELVPRIMTDDHPLEWWAELHDRTEPAYAAFIVARAAHWATMYVLAPTTNPIIGRAIVGRLAKFVTDVKRVQVLNAAQNAE